MSGFPVFPSAEAVHKDTRAHTGPGRENKSGGGTKVNARRSIFEIDASPSVFDVAGS